MITATYTYASQYMATYCNKDVCGVDLVLTFHYYIVCCFLL